jgi:hypothetical protein
MKYKILSFEVITKWAKICYSKRVQLRTSSQYITCPFGSLVIKLSLRQ